MTIQIPDVLMYAGEKHNIIGDAPIWGAWPGAAIPRFKPLTTACWRGFVAMMSVDYDNWLRVVSIKAGDQYTSADIKKIQRSDAPTYEQLYSLFPGHDSPVTATWFTGDLLAGAGEAQRCARHELDFYSRVYPLYRLFHVKEGKVVKIEDHDAEWWYQRSDKGKRNDKGT